MTNREYLEQKKEAFFKKINDMLVKNHSVLYVILLLVTILLIILAVKITPLFLTLVFPALMISIGATIAEIYLWLDKEHKE